MRYQKEIEEILKISEEFGSKVLNKYTVLQAIYGEGIWKSNDHASLGHKLANMSTLFKLTNEIGRFVQDLERKNKNLDPKFSKGTASEHILWVELQKAILPYVEESITLLDICSHKLKQLRKEVKATLVACCHCDLTDLLPYLEVGNQDQIVMLQIMLQWVYPNGKLCCNKNPVGSASSHKITYSQNTPIKSPNISCDSTVLDTGIPKSDVQKWF